MPAFTPKPQSVTALRLVLNSRPAGQEAELAWVAAYINLQRWFARPKTVTHPSSNRESGIKSLIRLSRHLETKVSLSTVNFRSYRH